MSFIKALEKLWTKEIDDSWLARKEQRDANWKRWEDSAWTFKRWLEERISGGVSVFLTTRDAMTEEAVREVSFTLDLLKGVSSVGYNLVEVCTKSCASDHKLHLVGFGDRHPIAGKDAEAFEASLIEIVPTIVRIVRDMGGKWNGR